MHVALSARLRPALCAALLLAAAAPLVLAPPAIGSVGGTHAAPTNTVRPSISPGGPADVGESLTVDPGQWDAPQPSFTYQWYRAEGRRVVAITGAAAQSYTTTAADAGRYIAALVTATRSQDGSSTAPTQAVFVNQFTSTTSFTLTNDHIPRYSRGSASVVVSSTGGTPDGTIVLMQGSNHKYNYQVPDSGQLTISLPKFSPGPHLLFIHYKGNIQVGPSDSSTVRLYVRHQ